MNGVRNFEDGWNLMLKDLKEPKEFPTQGGRTLFEVWSESGRLSYRNSIENVCPLSQSDFKKAYGIWKDTRSTKTTDYSKTRHASYIPPLLEKYFKWGDIRHN